MQEGNNLRLPQEEVKHQVHPHPLTTAIAPHPTHGTLPEVEIETETEIGNDPDLEDAMIGQPPLHHGHNPDQTQQEERTTLQAQDPRPSLSLSTVKNMCLGLRKTKSGPSLKSVG
jgi:hypothetical protein